MYELDKARAHACERSARRRCKRLARGFRPRASTSCRSEGSRGASRRARPLSRALYLRWCARWLTRDASAQMENKKLKFGTAIVTLVAVGTLGPIAAVMYQQKKARG